MVNVVVMVLPEESVPVSVMIAVLAMVDALPLKFSRTLGTLVLLSTWQLVIHDEFVETDREDMSILSVLITAAAEVAEAAAVMSLTEIDPGLSAGSSTVTRHVAVFPPSDVVTVIVA